MLCCICISSTLNMFNFKLYSFSIFIKRKRSCLSNIIPTRQWNIAILIKLYRTLQYSLTRNNNNNVFCSLLNNFMRFYSTEYTSTYEPGSVRSFLWLLLWFLVGVFLSFVYDFYLKMRILFMRLWNVLAKKLSAF